MRQIFKKCKEKLSKPRLKNDKPPLQPNFPTVPDESVPDPPQLDPQLDPKPVLNSEPNIAPRQPQGRLWNEAYEQLESNNAELVESYEKILSQQLPRDQGSSEPAFPENRIDAAYDERWKQMQTIVEVVIERTKTAIARRRKIGGGLTVVSTAMNQAVRAVPEAAVAWTGVCFALEMLSSSFHEAKVNHEGIVYIVSRMDWYWHLADLLLDGNIDEVASSTLRILMEKHIADLYQKLLLYQMKSVCRYYRQHGSAIWRDTIKADDWTAQLDDIRNVETAVREKLEMFKALEIRRRLDEIDSDSHALRSELQGIWSMIQEHILSKEEEQCLRDLRVTDPRDDKRRIEDAVGGLLQGAYDWVIEHSDFVAWRDQPKNRLMWIKGDPGKGKTMLMCGIIDELQNQTTRPCYFFCQATDLRLNNATAVLRGLIYLLVDTNRHLLSRIQEKYNHAGTSLFQDTNSWTALSQIFTRLLEDPRLGDQLFMIDALDECRTDLELLLDLIVRQSANSRTKWIVSSRNWTEIEAKLGTMAENVRLSLELNEQSVSEAVRTYITHKAARLKVEKGLDDKTELQVREYLTDNARGTFLWVALVCKELLKLTVRKRHVLEKMRRFPPELGPLYARMMQQIRESEDSKLCEMILSLVSVVYRPISLVELASLLDSPDKFNVEDREEIIFSCGSFLAVKDDVVRFVHQSAQDFLKENIFKSEIGDQHYTVLSRSLNILSRTLRRDMYNLRHPGALIEDQPPSQGQDVLGPVRYSCVFWAHHLKAANDSEKQRYESSLQDEGIVHCFLKEKLLNWLEALSLIKRMPDAARTVRILERLVKDDGSMICNLVKDVYRFVLSHKFGIELAPLQVYNSALFFSPISSIVRQLYAETEGPKWVTTTSEMPLEWTAYLQIFEGHKNNVSSLAFSPDGTQLASVSYDGTAKIWDLETGACLHTFISDEDMFGHLRVAYSPHGNLLAVGSFPSLKLWHLTTLVCLYTFEMETLSATNLVFSLDCTRLAAICCSLYTSDSSLHECIRSWDLDTGVELETHDFGTNNCFHTIFAPDGTHLALVGVEDGTNFHIRNLTTNRHPPALDLGPDQTVSATAFSADAEWLALATRVDKTIRIFNCPTGACLQKIHVDSQLYATDYLYFSKDRTKLLSGSGEDGYIFNVWDPTSGACLKQFKTKYGHRAKASSPNGTLLAETWGGSEIKILDMAGSTSSQTPEGDEGSVGSVVFSADGTQVATAPFIHGAIRIWDPSTGACLKQFGYSTDYFFSLAFSPDEKRLAVGRDTGIEIWGVSSGVCLQKMDIDNPGDISSIAISSNGNLVAACISKSYSIWIWDLVANTCLREIHNHKEQDAGKAMAFSPDETKVWLVCYDGRVLVYDINTGTRLQSLDNPFGLPAHDGHLYQPQNALLVFDLKNLMHDPLAQHNPDHRLKLSRFSICPEGVWILRGQKRVLWLPPEYRPSEMAVYDGLVAIGCESGRMLFLRFAINELDMELAGNAIT
ncbi:hypothetical protein V8C37DRAFT_247410 [Trichoderma ceciliae]